MTEREDGTVEEGAPGPPGGGEETVTEPIGDDPSGSTGGAAPPPGEDAAEAGGGPQGEVPGEGGGTDEGEEGDGGAPAAPGEGGPEITPEMEADFKAVLEALLFSSSTPLTAARLSAATTLPVPRIKRYLAELREEYDRTNRAFSLEEIAGGYQLLTRPRFAPFVQKLQRGRASDKLTQAQMETLAIVAYKQPIIRADVEAIRGVQSGQILRSLLERRLIRVVGRDERLGHPLLYGTTRRFLEIFGLKSLKDLPTLEELKTI